MNNCSFPNINNSNSEIKKLKSRKEKDNFIIYDEPIIIKLLNKKNIMLLEHLIVDSYRFPGFYNFGC